VTVQREGLPTVQQPIDLRSTQTITAVVIGTTVAFLSVAPTGSMDADNVSDVVEALGPNNGDGNGDGVADAEQGHVTSLPILGGDVGSEPFVTLASDPGTAMTNVRTIDPEDPTQVTAPPPAGYALPDGLLGFSVDGIPAGSDQLVTIFTSSTTGINGYAKYQSSTGTWSLLPSDRVEVLPDRIVVRLTDGGIGDDDGVANGVIVDPGAPAVVSDTEAPTVTMTGVADGGVYTLGAVPGAGCTASDTGSGLAGPCRVSVIGGNASGVGVFTAVATASDKAGNTRTVSASYRVQYRFDGFEQPINDPARGLRTGSVFKKGSTVLVRIKLLTASGRSAVPVSAPAWVIPARTGQSTAPVNEDYSDARGTKGSLFGRVGDRWEYRWSTSSAQPKSMYRIGVRLDDGTTRYVVIGVR
jgi:hypothetical protein